MLLMNGSGLMQSAESSEGGPIVQIQESALKVRIRHRQNGCVEQLASLRIRSKRCDS
jgi:hypothetical protein